ncbi:MFS transporter [Streptomyces sp. NPDC014733]|uniref:MFS transporter n=1 Tax=Streptomyces sp. NPDC014733 TaxID=3364885 RepID=UPI0036FDEB7C
MGRSLRAARVATFVYFALCGTVMGTWVVQIPAIEDRVGISHATLGGLLVLLGGGAFLGMQVTGPLTDRLGARLVLPTSAVLCSAALVLPALAHGVWTLAVALLVLGFCNGCLDVSMNAHAVHVEKAYGRPVMSAFHATFSIGGVLAALLVAAATSAGLHTAVTMGIIAVAGIVTALVAARSVLPTTRPAADAASGPAGQAADPQVKRGVSASRIWFLAALAFMVMLCEGAANDWSALHMKDILGASVSTAAFAYGTYAALMTTGRLFADRLVARFGPMAILRCGAALAAVGITAVAVTPWAGGAFAGWALFGLGLSGCVPQLLSAAGHADPANAGAAVSRVSGLGYVGMLAGPAVIGWLTHLVPLNRAFLLLTLFCLIASAAAGVLRPGRSTVRVASGRPRKAACSDR